MRRGKVNKSDDVNPSAHSEKSTEENHDMTAPHPYENSIKSISTVKTVEQFWSTYNYLKRPNNLSSTTDYHFFRDGIKPTWEDPKNAKGGKWIIRLPKGLASRYWEEVVLALIGGQFPGIPDGEICGLVISIRYSEDILGIWNRSAGDRDMVDRLRDAVKKVLQLPPSAYASMEYKPHQNAIADRSSFRNTNSHWKNSRQSSDASSTPNTRNRSGSWVEREHPKPSSRRDSDRSWR
jgi:translation initiation factor 4E